MTFPVDDVLLGPASFGKRKGTEGIIWHTTEGADASRASAVATRNWQLTNPGSYGWIIYDGGLLLTVPYLEASGGVNPASTAWAPGRFPFLRQKLSLAAYADPNAYLVNVAFSGKTAVFRDQGMPSNMIDTAVALIRWIEAQDWSKPLVHSGHMHWQTNRSDPSQRVLDLIATTYAPPEDDMNLTTYALETIRIDHDARIRSAPTTGTVAWSFLTRSDRGSDAVRIGTVVNAMGVWSVFWVTDRQAWGYTAAQNVLSAMPLTNDAALSDAVDQANIRTAEVKKASAASLRNVAGANRDVAAGAEAAALNVESL